MAILKMQRLQLLGLNSQRGEFLAKLQSLGCLELANIQRDEWEAEFLNSPEDEEPALREQRSLIARALTVLDTYAPEKTKLFSPKPQMTEEQLFDQELLTSALKTAGAITDLESSLKAELSRRTALTSAVASLKPWLPCDLPLEHGGTEYAALEYGSCPGQVDHELLCRELEQTVPEAQLMLISADNTQSYMVLLVLRVKRDEALDILGRHGWTKAQLMGFKGTAAVNMAVLRAEIDERDELCSELKRELAGFRDSRDRLKGALDRLDQELRRREAQKLLLTTGKTFCLQGWVPEERLPELERLLASFICGWELSEPEPGENVPVKLKNSPLVDPMNMVTEMYSLPAYDGIDPNPLIFPFFTMFFGIMYADIGYGLILLAISVFAVKKLRLRGTLGYMARLAGLCGVTTIFWGLLFGSFFGDAVPVFCGLVGITHRQLWSLIDPLQEPMTAMVGSLAIGCLHILVGMAIRAFMLIREGRPWDALMDVGSWWLLFAGVAMGALSRGWYLALAGVLALVLTQGRRKPTLLGKLLGGIASLYDVTSYLGDVLSYTRLMALMLAGSVIASVVNVLGSLSGSVVVFLIVFMLGHAFNMGINIIGTYVHAARLQYLEFFGKFYKDGGRPFAPLAYKTSYTEIIKEGN